MNEIIMYMAVKKINTAKQLTKSNKNTTIKIKKQ